MLMRCMVVQMARYWRTCSMGMADSCGMAFTNAHIQDQLQCSLMEMRKHGRKACNGNLQWCRFGLCYCDVQGLEGLAHICIQHEYSEKGQTPLATFHVWGIQIKRSRPNFLALATPLLGSPIQVEEAANAATPSR